MIWAEISAIMAAYSVVCIERSAAGLINYQHKISSPVSAGRAMAVRKSGYRLFKRVCDIAVSLVLLAVFALPMLVIAAAVRIDSPGPAIFRQKRIGRDGVVFEILKFRTMYCQAPSETAKRDFDNPHKYITKVGNFLRRTSLDELPQFINILRGDMSLIGPRPLVISEEDVHSMRTSCGVYDGIRPGITGWAQVNGRDNVPVEQKVAFDKFYADNLSASLDMRILMRTVAVVLRCDGYREGKK